MKKLSTLWWVGALAILAGCDPYSATNSSPPAIVTAFATVVSDGAPGDAVSGTADEAGVWTIGTGAAPVPAGTSFIVVKFNKTMDGASIQAAADSCVPASDIKVNNVVNPPADVDGQSWHTCYSPGSGTAAEGASLIIYFGTDIQTGVGGKGPSDLAALPDGVFDIQFTPKDKQGRDAPVHVVVTAVTPA